MSPTPPTRVSEARDRLLRTASGIFYAKGIHAVGVDEIVETAQVTRSTLYRHFGGKDDLVVAYLEAASQAEREQVEEAVAAATSPEAAIRAIAAVVASQVNNPWFRGCAFLNAAAEYPEADHPVRQAVLAHRSWFREAIATAFEELPGHHTPNASEVFVMLRDGAMADGCLADPDDVARVFLRGVDDLLALPPVRES